MDWPHALLALPQVAVPQVGGAHAVQTPLTHSLPAAHMPQLMDWPHALLALPQWALPQLGGVHPMHMPCTHCPPGQLPQWIEPLPQAFCTVPQTEPPSAIEHSGAGAVQAPPVHTVPAAHEQSIVCPQPSVTLPHRWVCGSGVHVSVAQAPPSLGLTVLAATHWLPMQSMPAAHPPHAMGTPQASRPTMPHLPVHALGWHDCADGSLAEREHTFPLGQAVPQTRTLPEHGSV